jgi:hypothetical protein
LYHATSLGCRPRRGWSPSRGLDHGGRSSC